MKRHSAESALEDFAVVWKGCLSQKTTGELSEDDQDDVVDSVATEVDCLGGTDAPETRRHL